MNFLMRLFEDESNKPSSIRLNQFLSFLVATVFGIMGFYMSKESQSYAYSLVIAFLVGSGTSGLAGQVKSALKKGNTNAKKES